MLTHECSKSLPNAIIERTIIWILAWKLYFSSAAAAAGDSSRRARLCALARASLGRASLHVRRRRQRGSLLGVGTITPGCCHSLGWFRRRGSLAGAALANSVPLLARRFPDSSVRANCDNLLSGMIENILIPLCWNAINQQQSILLSKILKVNAVRK